MTTNSLNILSIIISIRLQYVAEAIRYACSSRFRTYKAFLLPSWSMKGFLVINCCKIKMQEN